MDRFTAKNIKDKQQFEMEKKEIYRYLKVEFKSSYGNEYYCPVTVLKVYGYSLVEDLREQVEISQLKLKNFNKLMQTVTKQQEEANSDMDCQLPAVPDICRLDDLPLSQDEMSNSQLFDVLESFIHNQQYSAEDEDSGSNIFADMASHSTFHINISIKLRFNTYNYL